MKLDSRPVRSEDVLVQDSTGVHVLLEPQSGRYYTLEDVGARVWQLCDGRAVSEIVDRICEEYDAPREQVASDVLALLGDLASERLVREHG